MNNPSSSPIAAPDGTLVPAPLGHAVVTLDGQLRVTAVAVARDWDLGREVESWVGRDLDAVVDPAGLHAVSRNLRDGRGGSVDVMGRISERLVPLCIAADISGDEVRLHVADRRGLAEVEAQLSRALAALETDRREDRGLDGRHRALLAGIEEAVVLIDTASGRMIEMTRAAGELLGGSAAGLAGAAFTQCFDGRRRSEFIDTLVASALAGDGDPATAELRQGRGRIHLWPSMARAAEDMLLVCRMRRVEEGGIDLLPHAMACLVAGTRDGVACLDAEGRVTHVNRAFVAMVGAATAAQVLGRPLATHLLRGAIDLQAMTEPGRPTILATRLVGTDGRRLPVEITATDLPDGGLGLVARDASLADVLRGVGRTPGAGPATDWDSLVGTMPLRDIVATTVDAVERSCIDATLALTAGNRAAAAEMLGLSRQSLYVKLRKFGLLGGDEI